MPSFGSADFLFFWFMNFLEKDLEQIIYEASDFDLERAGLALYGKRFRQLRIGNYGIADLITVSKEFSDSPFNNFLKITVYELKKDKISVSALLQAIQYCKGICDYFDKRKPNIIITLDIILIGKEIDLSGSFVYLTDLFQTDSYIIDRKVTSVKFYRYEYKINGLSFIKKSGYSLTNKGF